MPDEVTLAAIIAGSVLLGLMIVVGLPVVLTFRHHARQRAFEHAERMKALELGRPWPTGDANAEGTSPGGDGRPEHRAVKIGVWVPLGSLGIALAATSGPSSNATDVAVWVMAGVVGVAGLVCGTILALHAPAPAPLTPPPYGPAKPTFADDALDVVSRRG